MATHVTLDERGLVELRIEDGLRAAAESYDPSSAVQLIGHVLWLLGKTTLTIGPDGIPVAS